MRKRPHSCLDRARIELNSHGRIFPDTSIRTLTWQAEPADGLVTTVPSLTTQP